MEDKVFFSKPLLLRRFVLIVLDALSTFIALYGALWLRLTWTGMFAFIKQANLIIIPLIIINIVLLTVFKLYKTLWIYASIEEVGKVVVVVLISDAVLLLTIFTKFYLPNSVYFMYPILLALFLSGTRLFYRFVRSYTKQRKFKNSDDYDRVMIIGAGDAGEKVIREIKNDSRVLKSVECLIDDDEKKIGYLIHGIRVVGGNNKIVAAAKKYKITEIMIAIPSIDSKRLSTILDICKETKCKVSFLPNINQLTDKKYIRLKDFRQAKLEDYLNREPVVVNLDEIMDYVKDKTIVVTGGGGSIGSELCRQIAEHSPKKLVIIDIYENNAYDIQQELLRNHENLDLEVYIASIRDEKRIDELFKEIKPDIVYHAAAHKHVPLMEVSPHEAIKNNIFGTINVVKASDKYNVKKFIMISTDKAVNPTNIMGATKRICEMVIQSFDKSSNTEFVAVRFGNVLGSNGSVIPLFKKQIEEGGPVTVTDKEIKRYFMTIPEAVSLVLQAGSYAKGGEIFVLDMGKPVKIVDLARMMIKLEGYEPDEDIQIVYTGLRPGEKLFEEILMDEEGMQETPNKLIHIGKPIDINIDEFKDKINNLKEIIKDETIDIKPYIKDICDTYHPKEDK